MLLSGFFDFFGWLGDFFSGPFMDVVFNIFSFIPKIVYFIVACGFSVIDLFQVVFRKLAGLDVIMIEGELVQGDPAYSVLTRALFSGQHSAISTTFWSLIILGVVLVLATTFIAVIRVEIVPDKEKKNNSKETIIRNFFVALFNLAIVPISCILAMYLGNVMVGVIDKAISASETSYDNMSKFDKWTWDDYDGDSLRQDYDESGVKEEGTKKEKYESYIAFDIFGYHIPTSMEPFSGTMFKACAAPCNRLNKYGSGYLTALQNANVFGLFEDKSINESSEAADLIDTGFMYSAKLKLQNETSTGYALVYNDEIGEYCTDWMPWFGSSDEITCFSRYNVTMVWYFYDLWTFNYIVAYFALTMMLKLYWQFTLALMARMFEVIGLFLVAPIPVGVAPLDSGATLGRWRQKFYAKFCLMVIMVLGLNLVNPLITLAHGIKLFNIPFLDYIILSFFIIAALNAMDSINNMLSYILFDKEGQGEYASYEKKANAIQGGFNTGLSHTGKVAGLVTSTTAKGVGLAARGALMAGGAAVNGIGNAASAIRDAHYRNQEKRSIKKATKFNQAQQEKAFKGMSQAERSAWAKNYMNTAAGKKLLSSFNGKDDAAKLKNMEKALTKNDFRGKVAKGHKANDIRNQIYKDRHNQQLFAQTDAARGLTEGSAEYNKQLAKFSKKGAGAQASILAKNRNAYSSNEQAIRDRAASRDRWHNINVGAGLNRAKAKVSSAVGKVTSKFDKHVGKPVKSASAPILNGMFGVFGVKFKDGSDK